MIFREFLKMKTAVLFLILVGGCGSQAGNPSEEQTIVLPQIQNNLSDEVSSTTANFALTAPCTSILECKAQRARQLTDNINRLIQRLNTQSVRGVGKFLRRGPDNNIDVRIEKQSDTLYRAVLCVNSRPFIRIDWSPDEKQVSYTRDLFFAPLNSNNAREAISQITFSKTDTASNLQIQSFGDWQTRDNSNDDGTFISESLSVRTNDDESIEIKGVAEWSASPIESEILSPDYYLVGKILQDNTGEFAAYRKQAPNCSKGFDETRADLFSPNFNENNPRFCLGRSVPTNTPYNNAELGEALGRLESTGVESRAQLRPLTMDTTMSCD